MVAGGRVFRLVGNHEVFPAEIGHSSGNDERLLFANVEQHAACNGDLRRGRPLPRRTSGAGGSGVRGWGR